MQPDCYQKVKFQNCILNTVFIFTTCQYGLKGSGTKWLDMLHADPREVISRHVLETDAFL